MYRAIGKSFRKWMSLLLIFCITFPSYSSILAAPFWEKWTNPTMTIAPIVRRTKLVSILVEEDLLSDRELSTKIERYAVDVQNKIQGQAILVPIPRDTSPFELWLGNSQLYFSGHENDHLSQLVGTVFIGNIPLPIVNKEGRLHATPWPLTDFEQPSYFWDTKSERFIWKSGGDEQPEIWHGVIRSDATTESGEKLDLIGYFDRNHRIHTGEDSVDPKLFVADLPRQREGLNVEQRKMYENWVKHLEDFAYLRFNKNWLESMFVDLNPADVIPAELLSEEAQDVDKNVDFSAMPDVLSKMVIEQMAKRYLESAREKLLEFLAAPSRVGRWDSSEMDTTISLIAKKDEWAAKVLLDANNEVENIFRTKLIDPTLAIPATKTLQTENKYQLYQTIFGEDIPLFSKTQEFYVNGVKLSQIDRWAWDTETQEMKLFPPPPTCTDEIMNQDETGIDCGGSLCMPCTCMDGIMNNDETDIDCGGDDCEACRNETCQDGIQNQDEIGIDCGGDICVPCTCTNGIMDNDETDIDCGGDDCERCVDLNATCTDGIRNRDETGVDVGGSFCEAWTCLDGMMNRDETGIDCGGEVCEACSSSGGASCTDRILNQNETGIDCGGVCGPCESCADGILNQDEQGIDCGGTICESCVAPTCTDRFLNQDERGIDCGGYICDECAIAPPLIPQPFPAENCSYIRGTVPDDDHPAGQMAELNRAYNFDTALLDSCIYWDADDDPDIEEDRFNHDYKGCCAKNIEFGENGFDISASDCHSNGSWSPSIPCNSKDDWQCAISTFDPINTAKLLLPTSYNFSGLYSEYTGATKPIFDLKGSRPVTSGLIGAQGCEEFFIDEEDLEEDLSENKKQISTLMFHDEPRLATLQAQVASTAVNAMPADDPRGASFYDTADVFHRVNFPSSFDLIGADESILLPEDKETFLQSKLEESLLNSITQITNTDGNAGKILESDFDSTIWRDENKQQELIDALIWLGTDLEEKHIELLKGAFSSPSDGARILGEQGFNGYELLNIVGKSADEDALRLEFERGDEDIDPSNTFRKAEQESNAFHPISEEELLESMSEDELPEGWIAGEKSECSGVDLLTWPVACLIPWVASLPEVLTQILVLPFGSADSSKKIKSKLDGNVIAPQEIETIKVTPEKIVISANDVTPITLSVDLEDVNGKPIMKQTEVSIAASSADALDFFTISPSGTRIVAGGKTQFNLIPRTRKFGGEFSFIVSAGESSVEIPVSILRTELSVSTEINSVVAGEVKEINIRVRATDLEKVITKDQDGTVIEVASDLGTFVGGGKSKLKNGVTEFTFIPGTKAGDGIITIQDEGKLLPSAMVEFEILPAKAEKIKINAPEILVKNGVEIEAEAVVTDRFGNAVLENVPIVQWKNSTKDAGKGNTILLQTKELKPVSIAAELSEIEKSFIQKEIPVIDHPQLLVEVEKDSLVAGTENPFMIPVSVSKELPGSFEIDVSVKGESGIFPEKIILTNGFGELPFRAGTFAGDSTVTLQAPGFGSTTFEVEVLPADPYKIDLSAERTILQINDERDATLLLRVLDRFGNEVPFVEGEITLLQNPGEKWESADLDDLEDLGVFERDSSVKRFLEQELVDTELTTNPVVEFDPASPHISNGAKEVKINTTNFGGHIFLVAMAEGLIPDTLELDVLNVLKQEEFSTTLNPKSLLTLLLGIDGGKLQAPSFGNKFLFDGETQAVATLVQELEPHKIVFSFSPNGEFTAKELTIKSGNEFSFSIDKSATATFYFSEEPTLNGSVGWEFVPKEKVETSIKNNILWQEKNKILQLLPGGGFYLESNVRLLQTESWKQWDVQYMNNVIGTISLISENSNILTSSFIGSGTDTQGLLVESLFPEIYVQPFFTGKSTTDEMGIVGMNQEKLESPKKILRSAKVSAEDALMEDGVGWTTSWKPGALFAAGNIAGESVRIAASDAMILLGDPTISVPDENETNSVGFTDDIGKSLWTSSFGAIDQVLSADLNGDGRAEIFPRTGNRLFVLYQDEHQRDNFRDAGLLLRFADGVKTLVVHKDSYGNLLNFIQLNDEGNLILHTNEKGVLSRKKLDLGIGKKITDIKTAELNGDKYSDLVLSDEANTLWFAYGRKDGWYSAQYVESFALRFDEIDEKYLSAEDQGVPQTTINKFPQLDEFSVRFNGIDATDSWSGELDFYGTRTFVQLSDNRRFDAWYKMNTEDSGSIDTVVPGQRFKHSLVISGNQQAYSEGEFVLPKSVGFQFDETSFVCDSCETLPEIKVLPKVIQITIGNIPAHANIVFNWDSIAEEVLPIRYFVSDFEKNDARDDVAVAWHSDGTAETIQFISGENNGTVPARSSDAVKDAPTSPYLRMSSRETKKVFPDLLPSDFDAEATADDVLDCLGTEQTDDGLPIMFAIPSVGEALLNMLGGAKKVASWLDAIPSVAFLAPGPQSIYIPPYAIPIPVPAIGFPIFWVAPQLPPVGAGPMPTSLFRLYIIPTTSLQVGIAICGGPVIDPSMSPTGIPFPPQCFVIIPQFSSGSGGASAGGNSESGSSSEDTQTSCTDLEPANEATPAQEFLQQLFAPSGSGITFQSGLPIIIKGKSLPTNSQIKAADILSQWVQDQWREFTNFKFPKFKIKFPKFKSIPCEEGEPTLSCLNKSPFVDVKRKKITINYPYFPDGQFERLKEELKKWKKDAKEKLHKEKMKWMELGCNCLENGTWNKSTEECTANTNTATAIGLVIRLSLNNSMGTILRIKSLPATLGRTLIKLKYESLQSYMTDEIERVDSLTDPTPNQWNSEVEKATARMRESAENPEIEKQAGVIAIGEDNLEELKRSLAALEEIKTGITEQKNQEAKAFLTQKFNDVLKKQQEFYADLQGDVDTLKNTANEMDVLAIRDGKVILAILNSKIPPGENASDSTDVENAAESKKAELKAQAEAAKAERQAALDEAAAEQEEKMRELLKGLKDDLKEKFKELTIEPLEKKWEEFVTSVEKNIEALESYVKEIKKLKKIPKKLKALYKDIKKMTEVINEYWVEWINRNERAVEKWEEFVEETKKTIKAWTEIPEMLKKFSKATTSANGGSMSRGSMIAWLKNILLSLVKFPIIPMPQVPDVEVDLSALKLGLKLEVPELEFNKVEVSASGLIPPLPELELSEKFEGIFAGILQALWDSLNTASSLEGMLNGLLAEIFAGNISLEGLLALLANIPEIPEIPDVLASLDTLTNLLETIIALIPVLPVLPKAPILPDVALVMPPMVLPQLPSLIEPPVFPDFLKVPNLIMIVPKYILGLLSLICQGLVPVPEWMVAMSVVNATNRTLLLPLDFLAKLPPIPKLILPPLSFKLQWEFAQGLPSLVALLEASAAMFNCITTQLSNLSKGIITDSACFPLPMEPMSLAQNSSATKTIALLPEGNVFSEEELEIDMEPIKTFALESGIVPAHMRSWQVSTEPKILSIEDYPQSVPMNYNMDSVPDPQGEMQVEPRILWFDSAENKTNTVTNFPLQGRRFTSSRVDLDSDGVDEMLYAIDTQLFIKRRVLPEEEDDDFEVPQKLLEWDLSRFANGFTPSETVTSSVSADGSMLRFLPADTNDTAYFEWILSERPDRIFESAVPASKRKSKIWRRIGFLVRPPMTKYEIRSAGAQIKSVTGSPVMYGSPLKTIEKFSAAQCDDGDTQLPFFAEETIFVGKAEKSRLLVKTLARKGQVAEEREIELRKGEETVVDFAEVCLSRGDVQYLEFANEKRLIPKKKDYFFSGMRLELGTNDKVELDLFDDTNITLWGGEQYELHQFNSRKDLISSFKQLSRGNYYGQLIAFDKENKSWTRSKNLLHDPQSGDDVEAPRLELRRGTERSVLLGQKIELDASGSRDNQEIERVWWEVRGETMIDSQSNENSPQELLKILLPAEHHVGVVPVVLHVTDVSGNESVLSITITVKAPELELREASVRDLRVSGNVISGEEGIEVWFIRERDGRKEILSRTATSEENGSFVLENLSRTGGAVLRDKYTKKSRAEVLETGRPVLLDEKLTQTVQTATDEKSLNISLRENTGEEAAKLIFVAPEQSTFVLPKQEKLLDTKVSKTEVQLADAKKDSILWRKGVDGISELWDEEKQQVLGTIDSWGQFKSLVPDIYLQTQVSVDDTAPVVFEIWRNKILLAQFSHPVPRKIKITERVDETKEVLQNPDTKLEKKAF